ncbi:MAG: CapA family protein [Ruminococcaceae bacterium]|nr:CapA family protein [Oscillospiraceae bacterium]
MKLLAAGDAIIGRRIQPDFKGYDELRPYIESADASFFNLETTLNEEGECPSAQLSGGTYIRTTPKVLEDMAAFGFNMTTFNNNHAFDFSVEGFLSTLEALEDSDFVHAGAGRTLGEASKPRYLESNAGRIALISANTNFSPDMLAGEQTARVPGRAGINGITIEKYVRVTEREMAFVKELAEKTGINVSRNITVKEGYYQPTKDNEELLGELKFVLGDKCEYVMEAKRTDVERVKTAIYEAKLQADYIMVSIHSHQLSGDAKENPSQFLIDFAHECIDAGAHAIIGHGPHLLRPIEVYKDCPIFYSLGDFILQLYNIEFAPAEFFRKYGLSPDATVHELLKTRSKNFTIGLMEDPRMYLNVLPLWDVDECGKLKSMKLIPVEATIKGNKSEIGLPRICDADKVVSYLGKMSEPYGIKLTKDKDGLINVKW